MVLPFDITEYQNRLDKTKKRMEENGLEVLCITNPSNMNYLTGYDAWSFYVHQMLIVIIDEPQPLWIGRTMDANGAKATTWIYNDNVIAYPDYYVHSDVYHPMDFIGEILREIGQGNRRTGVELEQFYFTAKSFQRLQAALPDAVFSDASNLVGYVRLIKSEQEIEYMRRAGIIVDEAMRKTIDYIQPGVRENDAVAKLYYHLISGTPEYGGDYPAIVPMMPTGDHTSMPHLTWSDQPFQENSPVVIETAGCYKRYHVPMARTISLGEPGERLNYVASVVEEGIRNTLEVIRPGARCSDLEAAWRNSIKQYGFEKEARLGYSTGLSYPPDWGEHTVSIRKDDHTVLEPNMTFHIIPALWFENDGIEISTTFRVTETGYELFTTHPLELIRKESFGFNTDSISS
ncbi:MULTISPECIES: M24 family metallopeptidase [Salimicrobium]|uniref:Ectoine hydrolase DoeA n=3 Tax=Salimicrobium TaxID=351195 RepID=K2FLB4_9BACI|nr:MULTISPECIES: M24 family metallopeptidase [Salimicrobium]AKG04726.1 ectoine hydrolase DoeA [Salimicrobium jeotgali]EKE31771.1 M24 family peptidase [Salimicrobium jeotgali]MBM7696267.1 Xaa-Pro dipeptidase [Salimicrobium jeotgali]SDX36459.1 Xaa-Pro dipeptidase [Salimicrobium album]SIS47510.1 Xaa-Pro dipeptidase [Salimicrobium salexigens]